MANPVRTEELFQKFAETAAIELFAAYGAPIAPRLASDHGRASQYLFAGLAGFVGPLVRGSVVLAIPEKLLHSSAPGHLHARDWSGELANQLLGRIKNKALRGGCQFHTLPPVVVPAGYLLLSKLSHVDARIALAYQGEPICLMLDIEISPQLVLTEPPPAETDVAAEGEMILF